MSSSKKSKIVVNGWCAFNKEDILDPPIDNMSFEKSYKLIKKRWESKGQFIRRCKVIIE